MNHETSNESLTLDPPGSIAVVGAGPLGVEAALYGRFLGYDITLFEADTVGSSMRGSESDSLPMLPDRCLSPLAISALDAQSTEALRVLPLTIGQWIDASLVPLTDTDLLKGRLRAPTRIRSIEMKEIEADNEDEVIEEIPEDFRLVWTNEKGESGSLDVEAVVLATGQDCDITFEFETPAPYLFRIGDNLRTNPEAALLAGFHQIVAVYAQLAGRPDLDLYRPRRS